MIRLNFSDYRRWVPKETFVSTLLSGQQVEQLYVPGTKEPYLLAYHYLKSRFCLTRLIPNFSDATMYTVFERRLWSATEFTFTWPSLRVEELCPPVDPKLCPLRKEDFCPFMLWVTLPREYLRVMTDCTLQSTWNFGMITDQVSFMGDHFNFSFSPRSSLLLHTFNISISQVQGTFRMEERYFDAPVTIGFRPLWQDWESNGRTLWNRYYLDYFVHFQNLSSWTLGHFQGRCWITLLSAVCIMASTLCILYSTLIVSGVTLNFQCWCTFQWPEINEGLSRTGTFQETPRGTLSLRLHVADFETLIFGCCNFELSATCQDLTFVQFTLNSLTCKDCTLDLEHLWL